MLCHMRQKQWQTDGVVDSEVAINKNVHGTLAEWLRRQIRNLLGSARVSSNLTGVVPSWLSWQSVRLLTDRSLVRSQARAIFLACFNPD